MYNAQFNYCALVWMCGSRGLNNKINNLHKRALKIVYQGKKTNLQKLLQQDKSVSIHMKNLQHLATEICKLKNGHFTKIVKEVFVSQENEHYNLSSGRYLVKRHMHTAHFGTEAITNLGPKLWKLVPDERKSASPSCISFQIWE